MKTRKLKRLGITAVLAVLMMIPTFAMAEGVVKIGVFEPASGDSGAGGKQEACISTQ